jgi:hypothetical protein
MNFGGLYQKKIRTEKLKIQNKHILIYTFIFIPTSARAISHNVPAVYDGLAARIRKCVAFSGPTNCAGAMAWE